MILGDVVERNGLFYPSHEAVVDEKCRMTFAELADRTTRLANVLVGRGVRRGDRVAVLSANCHELVEVFGANEMCGFITVPLNVRQTWQELAEVLADCAPSALIFDRSFASTVEQLRPGLQAKTFVSIGGGNAWADDYESILAGAGAKRPATRAEPDDTAFILYTSGSTGHPKGVMHGHRGQIYAALSMCVDGSIEVDRSDADPQSDVRGRW